MRGKTALMVASTLLLVSPTLAKSKTGELLQYLNPVQKKGYRNESQDRVIKKKSFKAVDLHGASGVFNKELGLFAEVDYDKLADVPALNELLTNPLVNGLSVTVPWQSIEPEEAKFNWQQIDDVLQLCHAAKKTLILRVSTCGLTDSDTPKWVFDAGTKSAPYVKADGKQGIMPIFWDSTYLAKWANTVNSMGAHFDKNPDLHSVGITGGGMLGSTQVVPNFAQKADYEQLEALLKKDYGMSQRQLVQHWKYVADVFPRAFTTTRLNFDIDPPTPNRAGEDNLDEISDYLVFRYGERVYLTRQNVTDAKHGFDQYRIILKFKQDTLTGYQVTTKMDAESLTKLSKFALDDGTSYMELPSSYFAQKDEAMTAALERLRSHLGYQLICTNVGLPAQLKVGDKLTASFDFLNGGSAPAMRPNRQFDKDVASSYRIQLELRDTADKPVVINYHTPGTPTNKWVSGKPIAWEEDLTMPVLKPGQYKAYLSVVDSETKREIQILNAMSAEKPTAEYALAAGKVEVVAQ